jgi:hypothetical protein
MLAIIYLPIVLLGSIIFVCAAISVCLRFDDHRQARQRASAQPPGRIFRPRVIVGGGAGAVPESRRETASVKLRLVGADD